MAGEILKLLHPEPPKSGRVKWYWILFVTLFAIFFVALGFTAVYAKMYSGRVYPGVYLGAYHLGGLTETEVRNLVENFNNRLFREGIDFLVSDMSGKQTRVKLNNVKADDVAPELAHLDSEDLARRVMNVCRNNGSGYLFWKTWVCALTGEKRVKAEVIFDGERFRAALKERLAPLESDARNAGVGVMFNGVGDISYKIIPEKSGGVIIYDKILPMVSANLSVMSFAPAVVALQKFQPTILFADAEKAAVNLPSLLSHGSIGLNFISPHTEKRLNWVINPAEYSSWLEVKKDEETNLIFVLSEEKVKKYLDILRFEVEEPVEEAKFVMEEGRVKEFKASHSGLAFNIEKTYRDLARAFRERNYRTDAPPRAVSLSVDIIEPKTTVADMNDLGIREIIGSGTSTFFDSHTNRIKNIANAVKRLNGILIKPGEEFSTINGAGPFNEASGFLPEDIIKGDKIKKEVGGGMCQIGTTLFRMAMNSGMPITNRRNHSLVVGYYADPVNRNPGTDATVYEPQVDFKFLNDTGHYLLLQTSIDYKKQMLTFTLWGQPDGRDGWYDHPKVLRWIAPGDPKEVEDPKLKPDEKKCQNAFRGAVAKFTYTRVTPAGEKIERVFDSYYRPLPKICLVGKKSAPPPCPPGESCASSTAAAASPSVIVLPAE